MKFYSELEAAKVAAKRAGVEIMKIYAHDFSFKMKEDNSEVTIADQKANEVIVNELEHFGYQILSEEGEMIGLTDEPIWIIDPLDGTRDFIKKNGEFCVMIGLIKKKKPVIGVVYFPVLDKMLFAQSGKGAYCEQNGKVKKIGVSKVKKLSEYRVLVSRSRFTPKEQAFAGVIGREKCTQKGSMGWKVCDVAEGNAEAYYNLDGANIWDLCAPHTILIEAGGRLVDLDEKPISYSDKRVKNGVIAINGPGKEFFRKLLAFVKKYKNTGEGTVDMAKNSDGKLVWITGLAGSGKTTVAKKLFERAKAKYPETVFLDGDMLRQILGNDFGHSIKDRKITAYIYVRLVSQLTKQGINVIISTISLFHEIHDFNRKNNKNYYEVLLEVDKDELLRRNQKKLYTHGKNVMGVHQTPEFPKKPFLVLKNNTQADAEKNVQLLFGKIFS